MIKANELKRNNYIFDRAGKILKIDWFEKNTICYKQEIEGVEVHPLTEDIKYLQPIPLTEEMLLRCGAKFNGSDIIINNTLVIEEAMAGEYFYTCGLGVKLNDKPMKYLHQLQNWYYLHTGGEELEIKL